MSHDFHLTENATSILTSKPLPMNPELQKRYPETYSPEDFLFFLHIPKTAGTSLTIVLSSVFSEEETIAPIQFNNVRKYPKEIFERAKFLAGHFPHREIRRRLPKQPNFAITFLREPVAHFQSLFLHLKVDSTFAYTTRIVDSKEWATQIYDDLQRMTLTDFVDSEHATLFKNFQTRYLVNGLTNGYRESSDEQLLPIAESLLLGLPFFGITEQFSTSVELLGRVLRLDQAIVPVRENAARNRTADLEIDDALQQRLLELTSVDKALYDFACTAFAHRAAGKAL